jgi:hypothetical protein
MVEAASALEVRAFWIGSLRPLVALSCSMRLALEIWGMLFNFLHPSELKIGHNLWQCMAYGVWFP